MRELNSTKIIGLDEGYGNIKTANTVTPTAITAYDTEPIFSGNILEYGGRYYRIGEMRIKDARSKRNRGMPWKKPKRQRTASLPASLSPRFP